MMTPNTASARPREDSLRLFALLALVSWACAGEPRPVPVTVDEDICSYCRMVISQRELAAELVTRDGRVEMFDDIGCLLDWRREHDPPGDAGVFVADAGTGDWLRAEEAVYLRSSRLPTPMGHGVAAFPSRAAALAEAERLGGGTLLGWQELAAGGLP